MRIEASAPGKLVIAGDYAVLEGARAVVMAVDRRARVVLHDRSQGDWCVDAPDLGVHQAHGSFRSGALVWDDADVTERLRLVASVYQHLAGKPGLVRPCAAELDTHGFFSEYRPGDKLGLGSSAALSVALVAAIHALAGRKPPGLEAIMSLHRALQGGRGSGLDIAASRLGGVLVYQLGKKGRPRCVQTSWPRELALCCVWSGRPASTGSALAQLAEWRARQPAEHDALMRELTARAAAVAGALEAGDAATMLDGMAGYAAGLSELGAASGIDIVCDEHRAVGRMANDAGVVYKTCGAGGGDVGIACATDTDRLTHFAHKVDMAGFYVLNIGIDAQGLSVRTTAPSNRRKRWATKA